MARALYLRRKDPREGVVQSSASSYVEWSRHTRMVVEAFARAFRYSSAAYEFKRLQKKNSASRMRCILALRPLA